MRFLRNNTIIKLFYNMGISYPVPSTISYLWNFGSLALICLLIQIITGIFLAMHYVANIDFAFLFSYLLDLSNEKLILAYELVTIDEDHELTSSRHSPNDLKVPDYFFIEHKNL